MADLRERVLVWPAHDDRLVVNPGVRPFLDVPLGLGRTVVTMLDAVTADTLKKILRRWGREGPTRKADLVEAVATGVGDPVHVRRLVAAAQSEVARRLRSLAEHGARQAGAQGLPAGSGPTDASVAMYLRTPEEYRAHRATSVWVLELVRGQLRGRCHLRNGERVFTVANILSVAPA